MIQKTLYALAIVGLVLLFLVSSCTEEEPVSIEITGTTLNEGFPYQKVRILFNNPSRKKFDVFFGDKPSVYNQLSTYSGDEDGMTGLIPMFNEDEEVIITLRADGKTFTVPGVFKLKSLPKVTYVSSDKCAFRIPLKIVVTNPEYFDNGDVKIYYSNTAVINDEGSPYDITFGAGDTIIVNPSSIYNGNSNYKTRSYRLLVTGYNVPSNMDLDRAVQEILDNRIIYFHPSYRLNLYNGKSGEFFNRFFDNAPFWADDMTLKIGDVTVVPDEVNIIGSGIGYTNGKFGMYRIPDLPPGNYTITVTDPNGVEYIPEDGSTFTIEE